MKIKKYFQKRLFHIIWGKEKKYNNPKFDTWRAKVVTQIIVNDPKLSKLYMSIPKEFLDNHWIGKPMRSEYHSLIHFYRLAQTILKFEQHIDMDSSLLDVGCASGLFMLLWPNDKKQGIDQLPDCNSFGEKYGLNIVQGNAEKLPFLEKSYDFVLLLEIIEHVSNPYKVLEEAKRVSKNKIICTFPVFKKTMIKPYDSKQHFKGDAHYLELTSEDFINLTTHLHLEKQDFVSISIRNKLSLSQKLMSYLSNLTWPEWHLFVLNP